MAKRELFIKFIIEEKQKNISDEEIIELIVKKAYNNHNEFYILDIIQLKKE